MRGVGLARGGKIGQRRQQPSGLAKKERQNLVSQFCVPEGLAIEKGKVQVRQRADIRRKGIDIVRKGTRVTVRHW